MEKTKTNTTADLVVKHSYKHLQKQGKIPKFPKLYLKGLQKLNISSTALFTLAGILVLTLAYQLVKFSVNIDNPAFIAENATDYAAQTAFYAGETMHSAAEMQSARELIAQAAQAAELSRFFSVIGFALVIVLFWYLNHAYGIFEGIHPHFRIRRIR